MSLRKNIIANYLGQGWTAIMGFAFVPVYISYLGVESFGLIGAFTVLVAILSLLDMGMTPTINREMAAFSVGEREAASIRDLVRSMEVLSVTFSVSVFVVGLMLSGLLAENWFNAETLSIDQVSFSLTIMFFVVSLGLVGGIYKGILLGLQRQVLINVIDAGFATIQGVGAVVVLVYVSPNIESFFIWQACVAVVRFVVYVVIANKYLPWIEARPHFSRLELKKIWNFARGIIATMILAMLLTQIDKVLLSRLLSLEEFGFYMLATMLSIVLYRLIGPVQQAYFPKLSSYYAKNDLKYLTEAFHQAARLMVVLVFPFAMMLILFSDNLLFIWTGDALVAENSAPLLSLLAVGTVLNGIMQIPHALQMAVGWTGFAAKANLIAVIFLVPAIFFVTPVYGGVGAAWVWVVLNVGYLLISTHFMHRKILQSEKWNWYFYDVLAPIVGALSVGLVFFFFLPKGLPVYFELLLLALCGILSMLAALFSISEFRGRVLSYVSKMAER